MRERGIKREGGWERRKKNENSERCKYGERRTDASHKLREIHQSAERTQGARYPKFHRWY